MKKYRQLIKELPSKKVVFAFGRFQPPTTGHELLVNAVKKIASAQKADHVIYASRSQDKKSNPLPVDRKVYYLNRMFPKTNFIAANEEVRTFMEAAKALSKKYKNIIMVAGSDRVPEYKKLLDKYNGDVFTFDTVEVVSAGERDPDADSASGMSGTKMRDAAKKGDFKSFKRGLPHTLTELDGKRLMNEIRQGMGVEAVKEQVKFETNELREKYFAGEIFHVGEIVESEGVAYQIVKRGSNHLLVQNEEGQMISKFPQDLEMSNKEFNLEELNEMIIKSADKLKVARIIASSLGMEDVDDKTGAENMVNISLRKIKSKNLTPEAWKILGNMLKLATDAGINYDKAIIPETKFKVMGLSEETPIESEETPIKKDAKVGHSLGVSTESHRLMKVKYKLGEEAKEDESELEDKDIDDMINGMSEDDYLEVYDDEELSIIDDETGEHIAELKEDVIMEVLSRAERIRAKIRFSRTQAKRERRTRIALKTHSNTATLNNRARRLAINMMKKRLAKKPLDKLSVGEKERIEATMAKRKKIIDRIAMRLVPRVKKTENDRLSHKTYTK
jgi:nicotinamide mononucleotide adenylyltransferase